MIVDMMAASTWYLREMAAPLAAVSPTGKACIRKVSTCNHRLKCRSFQFRVLPVSATLLCQPLISTWKVEECRGQSHLSCQQAQFLPLSQYQVFSAPGQKSNINGNFIHLKMNYLDGLISMFWPHVCGHARVGGFLRGASSLPSSDQLVAQDTLHQAKIPIDHLKVVPPRATSAFARHSGRPGGMFKSSVIHCMHFWSKPIPSHISGISQKQNLFADSMD